MTVPRTRPASARLLRGLTLGILALGVLVVGTRGTQDAVANGDTRSLSIRQMHTGDRLTVTFRRNGRYDREALRQLDWIMRDWRRDSAREMDPRLYDVLWEVYRSSGSSQPLHVVSAYRSPQTNEMLRSRSRAVAQSSQHIEGKAVDFYLPDVQSSSLRTIGIRLQRGGVGFYPRANTPFVHIDVGSVRHWPRMTRSQLAGLFPNERTVHIPSDGRPMARYDDARREILAAGGTVMGEQGTAVASGGGRQRSLWSALFGNDESEASGDEAYAALPVGPVSEIDQRYAMFNATNAAPAPAPAAPVASVPRTPTPAPAPEPAPAPPAAIAAIAPPLPPARPADIAPAPAERSRIAELAEAAAAAPTQPTFVTASASSDLPSTVVPGAIRSSEGPGSVLSPMPIARPANLGGAAAETRVANAGPNLVWTTGPEAVATADEPASSPIPLVSMPLPVRNPARATVDAAPAVAVAAVEAPLPPRNATAFAAPPPAARADAAVSLASLTGSLGLRGQNVGEPAVAPAPIAPSAASRTLTAAATSLASLPQQERDALRALFTADSVAPTGSATRVRVSPTSVRDSAPTGIVAFPSSRVASGFTRTLPSGYDRNFRSGPAIRRVTVAN